MTQTAHGPSGQAVSPPGPRRHPLAPLTVAESATAARIALATAGDGARLTYCELVEPAKEHVLSWDAQDAQDVHDVQAGAGQAVPRLARCVLYQPTAPDGAAHTTV